MLENAGRMEILQITLALRKEKDSAGSFFHSDCLVTNKHAPDSQGYWLAITLVFLLFNFFVATHF